MAILPVDVLPEAVNIMRWKSGRQLYVLIFKHQWSDCGVEHNFLVLLPTHSKAKGFLCDLQCAADGNGWVTGKAADVFMGDLESVTVGIVDLKSETIVCLHFCLKRQLFYLPTE